MKKTTRLIGVIATAMVLLIAFSGVALASQPVCPTPETEMIKTVTMISCQGMVTEMEKVSWESSNEDLINNPPLGAEEVVGKMDYLPGPEGNRWGNKLHKRHGCRHRECAKSQRDEKHRI